MLSQGAKFGKKQEIKLEEVIGLREHLSNSHGTVDIAEKRPG
jgi:hypothetical protein